MSLIERLVDAREEELAREDEAFKDSGHFSLSFFEGPDVGQFPTIESMIAEVDKKLEDPKPFFCIESDLASFRRSKGFVEFRSVEAVSNVANTARATIHESCRKSRQAVIIVPHWNALEDSYNGMARALSLFGFSSFVLTLPHHHSRSSSPMREVANDFLNADLGVAIRSVRQSVCDVRSLVTWLVAEGFADVHLIGVSLGSCVAGIAAAFDSRLASTSLFLTAGDFAETVWFGRATQHIRRVLDPHIELAQLKRIWAIISPSSFLDNFLSNKSQLFMINGRQDKVVPLPITSTFVADLRARGITVQWSILPCGHYTLANAPFSWISLLLAVRFMRRVPRRVSESR